MTSSATYQADPAEQPLPTGSGAGDGDGHGHGPLKTMMADVRPTTATTTAEIDTAITHPGSVKINVTGAFIVDQGSSSPSDGQASPTTSHEHNGHQTKDIRLPNHTAVVSHVAIDVCHYFARIACTPRDG